MKKFLVSTVLLLFINVIVSVYFSNIALFNILPAMFLIFLTYFSVNLNLDEALVAGGIIGLLYDIFFGTLFGFNTLFYIWAAFSINFLVKKYFSKDFFITIVLTIFTILFYELCTFVVFFLFQGKTYLGTYMLSIVAPEIIYTLIIYYPVVFVLDKYRRFLKKMSRNY